MVAFADHPGLELHLAPVRQSDRTRWAEYAILKDCVNRVHFSVALTHSDFILRCPPASVILAQDPITP
jgi:hypothetical protein